MENREYPRKEILQDAQIILNDSIIKCMVQNISCAGALVRIDENRISNYKIEIGIDITIVVATDDSGVNGKILRIIHDGDFIFFAVYFLKHYNFE